MGLVNGAWLADGSYLNAVIGVDRHIAVLLRRPDGTYEKRPGTPSVDWYPLPGSPDCTSIPEVTGFKDVVLITVLSAATPPVNLPDFWKPMRCEYRHDTARPFGDRFSAWKPLGHDLARIRPTIPPLP